MDVYLRVRLTAQLTLALLVRDISKYAKDGTVPGKRTLWSLVYLQILGLLCLRFITQTHMHVDVKNLCIFPHAFAF